MNKTDKKVRDYLDRAIEIAPNLTIESITSSEDRVVEIAKMIQREENK